MSGGGDLHRKTTQGCTHSDLRWPEEPTRRLDGKGWLWHCTCRRCGAPEFRAAKEPGADKYGLQPDVRAQVEEAWREFAEGVEVGRRHDRAALVQRLKQAYRLHAIRLLFATARDGGSGSAPLDTDEGAAESAATPTVPNRTHPPPPSVLRPTTGWLRWLHDKRLDARRAREYVLVGSWLADPASERFREAVKRKDALPEGVPAGWTEVLAEARGWRRDTDVQQVVEKAGREVAAGARHASGLRRVYDEHVAAGRTVEAELMKETLDGAEQALARARVTLRDAECLRDHLPRPVEAGAVTVRMRGDVPQDKVAEVEVLLRPVLEPDGLAASVTLKAAGQDPRGA